VVSSLYVRQANLKVILKNKTMLKEHVKLGWPLFDCSSEGQRLFSPVGQDR